MKNAKNHRHQTQRKVLRQARQEAKPIPEREEAIGQRDELLEELLEIDQEMRVEVEQVKMIRRPGPLKDKSWKGQKSIVPRRMH